MADDRWFPDLSGTNPKVKDALLLLYDAFYHLAGKADKPSQIEAPLKVKGSVDADNTPDPRALELITRKYADNNYARLTDGTLSGRIIQIGSISSKSLTDGAAIMNKVVETATTSANIRKFIWWIARNSVQGGLGITNRGVVRDSLGRYVVVTEGNDCIRSTDGITWSRVLVVPAPNNSSFRWVDVNGSRIGTCDVAGRVYKSDDGGATWTITGDATPFHSHGMSMIHYTTGNVWVVASGASGLRVYRSTDNNATWAEATIPETAHDIQFDGTTYVYVGAGGAIRTSTDFSTWTLRTSGTVGAIRRIAYSPTLARFVAVLDNTYLRTSDDSGVTWVDAPIKPSGTWNVLDGGIIWTGSEFWLCIGNDASEKQLAHSKDGKYWNWLNFPGGNSLMGIWHNDGDIAVGCGLSDFIATLGI